MVHFELKIMHSVIQNKHSTTYMYMCQNTTLESTSKCSMAVTVNLVQSRGVLSLQDMPLIKSWAVGTSRHPTIAVSLSFYFFLQHHSSRLVTNVFRANILQRHPNDSVCPVSVVKSKEYEQTKKPNKHWPLRHVHVRLVVCLPCRICCRGSSSLHPR